MQDEIRRLAQIRARLRDLKAEEAALRRLLEPLPLGDHRVGGTVLRIETRVTRRFDPKALPPAVRDDPAFWREQRVRYLRFLEDAGRGLPAHRPVPETARLPFPDDDPLIEPFEAVPPPIGPVPVGRPPP